MSSKGRLFAKALIESPVISNAVSSVIPGSTIAPSGILSKYDTVDELPLTGNNPADQAYVAETNRLYLWTGTGWYNIALINTSPSITSGYESGYLFETDGTPIEITLVGSDPEGIPLTWSYEVTAGSLTNGGGTTATVSNVDNVFTITPSTTEDYAGSFSLTFKASDGVNLATAVSSFTLAFKILNSKYTSLLVKGLASGNNATFIDSSTNNFTITKNGDTTQGTFSPFSQPEGAWSNYFDGSGDNLVTSYNTAMHLSGDFTIECWIYPTSSNGGQIINFAGGLNIAWASYELKWNGDSVNFAASSANTGYDIGSETGTTGKIGDITLNKWYHVAVTRSGNVYRGFLNGVLGYTQTLALTPYDPNARGLTIGSNYQTSWGVVGNISDVFTGYISNARIVKGTALYTANFTPPTDSLTAVTNTSLLTCQSNRFVDNSTNAFAITVAGNTAVSPFGPFDRLAYDPAVHGGSAYFDATGDWLAYPTGSLDFLHQCTADYTVEGWVYRESATSSYTFSGTNGGATAKIGAYIRCTASATVRVMITRGVSGSTRDFSTGAVITTGAWHHVAVTYTNSTDTHQIIVDGVLAASNNTAFSFSGSTASSAAFGSGVTSFSIVRMLDGTAIDYTTTPLPTAPWTVVADTHLLLNCTNADIIDNASKNNLKLVGNTAASATQTKYAARSVYFDGTGDYITATVSPEFVLGTGDFTLECWVYPTTVATTYQGIFDLRSSGSQIVPTFGFNTNTLIWYVNGSFRITSGTVTANAWYHVAVVRSSSETKMYINGTQSGSTYTDTNNYGANIINIGQFFDGYSLNGYIEDLRITKGLARYTANFTPPTLELLG